jgi:hypothetical protein
MKLEFLLGFQDLCDFANANAGKKDGTVGVPTRTSKRQKTSWDILGSSYLM